MYEKSPALQVHGLGGSIIGHKGHLLTRGLLDVDVSSAKIVTN